MKTYKSLEASFLALTGLDRSPEKWLPANDSPYPNAGGLAYTWRKI
jgi:hypothetical protein